MPWPLERPYRPIALLLKTKKKTKKTKKEEKKKKEEEENKLRMDPLRVPFLEDPLLSSSSP